MCLAIPARIVGFSAEEAGRALVEVAGVRRHIHTGLLEDDPPRIGDWVLVHVGFAMSKVSESQALDQLRTLSLLGENESIQEEFAGYGTTQDPDSKAQVRGVEP
jgi:hydrogenase expression/formation protein HypC